LQIPKAKLISLIILFTISACVGDPIAGMRRFKDQMDKSVAEKDNIDTFLHPRVLSVVRNVQEVRTGVMEYSFEPKHFWSEEGKCKYILIVAKDTGTLIGWRYNGKPENCQNAR
jgi:hypothetical protein